MSDNLSPSKRYVYKIYYRNNQRITCSKSDFVTSVKAAVLLRDPNIDLDQFFHAIDQSLATGSAAVLPELFKNAIKEAIDDQRLPHPSHKIHQSLPEDVAFSDPDPGASEVIVERAVEVQKAVNSLTDPFDRKIVQLRFFDPTCDSNVQVAAKIGRSAKFVGRKQGRSELPPEGRKPGRKQGRS